MSPIPEVSADDKPIRKRVATQISSGRWLLTVAAALAFLILVVAYVKKGKEYSISPDALAAIITCVFTNYFLKNGDDKR